MQCTQILFRNCLLSLHWVELKEIFRLLKQPDYCFLIIQFVNIDMSVYNIKANTISHWGKYDD